MTCTSILLNTRVVLYFEEEVGYNTDGSGYGIRTFRTLDLDLIVSLPVYYFVLVFLLLKF